MANLAALNPKVAGQLSLFIDQTGSIGENRREGLRVQPPQLLEKKKGGAMNAPPLKGSDTSVSSPKRQTAEAVQV
jgi:hypothetical protein